MDRRQLVIVAALALVAACEKKPATAQRPPDLVAKPTSVDVAKLSAPALFANVPADTPVSAQRMQDLWSRFVR
jgi:hypothetical protein